MWIRKSEEAIREVLAGKERKRKSLVHPFAWAALLTGIVMLFYSLGLRACSQTFVVLSNAPTRFGLRLVLMGGGLFIFLFALSLLHQRRYGGLFAGDETVLCLTCKESQRANPEMRCDCGGILEPFDYFDWIPDGDEEKATTGGG